MPRLEDLKRFYKLMKWLEKNTGGKRKLEDCNPLNDRTDGGVYFFFEEGEIPNKIGSADRIVQVGKYQSYNDRISRNHKGKAEPLTGSVFRKWIANARNNQPIVRPRLSVAISRSVTRFRPWQSGPAFGRTQFSRRHRRDRRQRVPVANQTRWLQGPDRIGQPTVDRYVTVTRKGLNGIQRPAERLLRGPVAERFARSVVEPVLYPPDLLRTDCPQIGRFREISPHQAVGMLVQSPFPGVIRAGSRVPNSCASDWCPANSLPLSAVIVCTNITNGSRHCTIAADTAAAVFCGTYCKSVYFKARSTNETSAP